MALSRHTFNALKNEYGPHGGKYEHVSTSSVWSPPWPPFGPSASRTPAATASMTLRPATGLAVLRLLEPGLGAP